MNEITVEEQTEIDEAKSLATDIKYLMKNPQFQRVIIDRYIKDTSFDVGVSFTGSKEDIDRLTSVTKLSNFLAINS